MNQIEIIDDFSNNPCQLQNIHTFIDEVLKLLGIRNWSLGLLMTNNSRIQENNHQWRNIDAPTDVLSFSQSEGQSIPNMEKGNSMFEAGDIVVSLERVIEQSEQLGRPFEEELRRVIIHGILHLQGMEHPNDDYEGSMLKLQEKLVDTTQSLVVNN